VEDDLRTIETTDQSKFREVQLRGFGLKPSLSELLAMSEVALNSRRLKSIVHAPNNLNNLNFIFSGETDSTEPLISHKIPVEID